MESAPSKCDSTLTLMESKGCVVYVGRPTESLWKQKFGLVLGAGEASA